MKPSLVILAAGIGSRYGGLKQIDPVGPNGELVIDYSIFDALRAGFGRVVFVIRQAIEKDFRDAIGKRIEARADVAYAFQESPASRKKPWGTAHAVLSAKGSVAEPFAVINADDFYGATSYRLLSDYLQSAKGDAYAMVGFTLRNTLSEHGTVSRGLCACENGYLKGITEMKDLRAGGDEIVSMNCWGFTPSLFAHLDRQFAAFVRDHAGDAGAELYLPSAIDALIREGRATVRVLTTPDAWLGVTYQQDRPRVTAGIREWINHGRYPEKLWS